MKVKIVLAALIVLTLTACKKDVSTAEQPSDQPLLQDGPLSAQLGKLIYLGDHGFSREQPVWGRNSDELFITASSAEILRIDISAKKIDVVTTGGLVTGKTNGNSGIIFRGKVNNQGGYFLYNFSNNTNEKIIAVADNLSTLLNMAGNNILYYRSVTSSPGPPCPGFCWPLPGGDAGTFSHIDRQTLQETVLNNKKFILFSPDGSKTILSNPLEMRMYLFDNTIRTITDSFDLRTDISGFFFQNGLLQSFERDVFNKITIRHFKTGQILRQYQPSEFIGGVKLSTDGTKFYYSGGALNGNSLKLFLYDIVTNTETIIADLPFLQGGGLPFDSYILSDDNKRLVTQSGNDLYIKELN